MTSKNEPVERRKHRRFQIRQGTYVALVPPYGKVGPVIDISMGGLSFRYVDGKETTNGSYINILLTEANFYLENVAVKTILDCEIPDKSASSAIAMRRCGLQFGGLTHNQASQLKFFIENYSIGEGM
jgi:hypothetical protein